MRIPPPAPSRSLMRREGRNRQERKELLATRRRKKTLQGCMNQQHRVFADRLIHDGHEPSAKGADQ